MTEFRLIWSIYWLWFRSVLAVQRGVGVPNFPTFKMAFLHRYISNKFAKMFLVFSVIPFALALWSPLALAIYGFKLKSNIDLTTELSSVEKTRELYLVKRNQEGWDESKEWYVCYLSSNWLFDVGPVHYRKSSAKNLKVLKFYDSPDHPLVEVPEDPTWENIFESVAGKTLKTAYTHLVFYSVLTLLLLYFCYELYWVIKGGKKRRRY